jgi:hypothetical protein
MCTPTNSPTNTPGQPPRWCPTSRPSPRTPPNCPTCSTSPASHSSSATRTPTRSEDPFLAPGGEVAVDRLMWREVVWEVAPSDAGAVDVEDRVEDLSQVVGGRAPLMPSAVRASVRVWRHAVRRGAIKAQRASDRSDGKARRSVIPVDLRWWWPLVGIACPSSMVKANETRSRDGKRWNRINVKRLVARDSVISARRPSLPVLDLPLNVINPYKTSSENGLQHCQEGLCNNPPNTISDLMSARAARSNRPNSSGRPLPY